MANVRCFNSLRLLYSKTRLKFHSVNEHSSLFCSSINEKYSLKLDNIEVNVRCFNFLGCGLTLKYSTKLKDLLWMNTLAYLVVALVISSHLS
jgi:hypothetical protein